ncbi:PQQ-binding-like beta-propeller repeat protein [Neorhodopirellula lusitana]|nr:PQQ-binding-like beta-propeller repeat protein [Neorhodopirellula lusitana]
MKPRFVSLAALVALFLLTGATVGFADDWTGFLGPDGAARSTETVPTKWSDSENLLWKVNLPGSGSSSPVVVGDRVIVTCYLADGSTPKRQVICVDKNTGESLWTVDFPVDYREDGYRGYITEHGYASNTPVADDENVYVFLGKGGVHCISLDGKRNWSADVGKGTSNRQWGSAASLTLYQDTVIVNAAEEAKAILCLDKATGKEVWRQNADMLELTYGTPRIVSPESGDDELVISVPGEIWSMSPVTGKLQWYATSPMTGNVSPSVIVDGDTIYSFGGYRASGSIALKVGGRDDVTDSHVLWTNRSSSYVATPLLINKRLYWVDDRGIAYCTSAEDGEVVFRERVGSLENGRPVYASPILIGDKIYIVTRRSGTLVVNPGDTFDVIAQNKFASDNTDFNASPAVSDGKLYLRSNQALYCVGQ